MACTHDIFFWDDAANTCVKTQFEILDEGFTTHMNSLVDKSECCEQGKMSNNHDLQKACKEIVFTWNAHDKECKETTIFYSYLENEKLIQESNAEFFPPSTCCI